MFTQQTRQPCSGDDHERAFEDVQIAFRLLGEDTETLNSVAHILAVAGNNEKAMEVFERIMHLSAASAISRYQAVLGARGYYSGDADGIYDAVTRDALSACIRDACNAWSLQDQDNPRLAS